MSELESLVYRFAIEHGDAEAYTEFKQNESGETFRIDSFRIPQAVIDHDDTAMRTYLAAAFATLDAHGMHGDRKPAVCCQVADLLDLPHPWAEECKDGDGMRCPEGVCQTGRVEHDHDEADRLQAAQLAAANMPGKPPTRRVRKMLKRRAKAN